MPIDIETFQDEDENHLRSRTNAEKVVHFLSGRRDQAFTPVEIADETDVKRNSIHTVLKRLKERDLVRHKGDYYALGDPELVRDAYQLHLTMETLDEQSGEEDANLWREHAVEEG